MKGILDKQATFNAAWKHAQTMTRLSYDEAEALCVYKGDGLPGCLMAPFVAKDGVYKPEMEGAGISELIHTNAFGCKPDGWTEDDTRFLSSLQWVHDSLAKATDEGLHITDDHDSIVALHIRLRKFAKDNGLTVPEVTC